MIGEKVFRIPLDRSAFTYSLLVNFLKAYRAKFIAFLVRKKSLIK